MTLAVAKTAGAYEVRLHASDPTKATDTVHGMRIHVDGD
jgi:hypothetical protein